MRNKIKFLIIVAGFTSTFSFTKINAIKMNNENMIQQRPQNIQQPQNIIINQTYQKQVEKEVENILMKYEEINENFINNTEYKSKKEIEFINTLLNKTCLYLKDYKEKKIEKSDIITKLPKIKYDFKMLLVGFLCRKIYVIEKRIKEINENIKKLKFKYNKTLTNIIKFDIENLRKKILKAALLLNKYKEHYEEESFEIHKNYLKLIERIHSSEKNIEILSQCLLSIIEKHIEKKAVKNENKLNRSFEETTNNISKKTNSYKKLNKTFDKKLENEIVNL